MENNRSRVHSSQPRQPLKKDGGLVLFYWQFFAPLDRDALMWSLLSFQSRVDRFFVVQYTKTGKTYEMTSKYTKVQKHIPNGRKIDQIVIKYCNIFHCKALHNLPTLGFWVWRYTLWQPCFRDYLKVIQRNFRQFMKLRNWAWFGIIQKTRPLVIRPICC
jgi:hypothetical protein